MRKATFLFIALVTYTARAQVLSGTVVVINLTKDKLVVAADSRGIWRGTGVPPIDDYCKISTFGHQTIFTTVGSTSVADAPNNPGTGWDNVKVAHIASQMAKVAGGDIPGRMKKMASQWANMLVAHWNSLYLSDPKNVVMSADRSEGVLTGGFFASAMNGTIYSQVTLITFSKNSLTPIKAENGAMECWPCGQDNGGQICAGGRIQVAAEFCSETSELAKREGPQKWTVSESLLHRTDKSTLLPIRIADLTVAYDPTGTVGGPIDAVELRNDGSINWFQRKQNCPESQE